MVLPRSQVWLFCSTSFFSQTLCKRIAETKIMRARQVVRDEMGQEVMLSFGSSPAKFGAGKDKAAAGMAAPPAMPGYLDEEDVDPAAANDKAVARVGDPGAGVGGWFTAIGGRFGGRKWLFHHFAQGLL